MPSTFRWARQEIRIFFFSYQSLIFFFYSKKKKKKKFLISLRPSIGRRESLKCKKKKRNFLIFFFSGWGKKRKSFHWKQRSPWISKLKKKKWGKEIIRKWRSSAFLDRDSYSTRINLTSSEDEKKRMIFFWIKKKTESVVFFFLFILKK